MPDRAWAEANASNPIADLIGRTLGLTEAKPKFQRTRFILELEQSGKFQVFSLSRPNRVVVVIPDVPMRLPRLDKIAGKNGLITTIRSGKAGPNTVRVIIGVAAPVIVENARMQPVALQAEKGRQTLSLDIVPVTTRSRAAVAKSLQRRIGGLGAGLVLQPPLPRAAEKPGDLRARSFKPVIVIDPGHGGHDTGATKHGVREKDVVLAFSLMLRRKLEKTGRYHVLMTRDDDTFVSLSGRREFADSHKAALFIAVHADYASTNASGATIYSLRDRVAQRLKSSAKVAVARTAIGETETSAIASSTTNHKVVRSILADLAQREVDVTTHRTDLFTQAVIQQMGQTTTMRSQPHRSAAFRVIKTAKMPSVLIELAYVSNRRDARRLTSITWRNKVSGSIVRAVDNYFSHSISRVPM